MNGRIGNAGGRPFIPAPGVATLAHEEHLSQSLDPLRCVLIAPLVMGITLMDVCVIRFMSLPFVIVATLIRLIQT